MAGAVAGVGLGLGLSCSTTTKLSQRRSSSSSSKTTRRCCVNMAISLDEKKKNYTLQKSEEAFAVAKVQLITILPPTFFVFLLPF
jgi:glutamate-1-semialdehyde 2,1-aminomutase